MESAGYSSQTVMSDFEFNQENPGQCGVNFDSQKPDYSIYGILNFLQSEWTKMSIERSRWEYERTELQTKIAVLQSEKVGCENLKNDLVRRIKMLEYALKQERFKNFSLKYPNESKVESDSCNSTERTGELGTMERVRLRDYLTRMGMNKLSNEMRALKVKELLGLTLDTNIGRNSPTDYSEPVRDDKTTVDRALHDETASALAEFDGLVAQQGDGDGSGIDIDILVDSFAMDVVEPPKSWTSGDQSAFVNRLKEHYRLGLPINRGGQVHHSTKNSTTSPEEIPIPPHAYDEMELFASQGRRFQSHTSGSSLTAAANSEGTLLAAAANSGGGAASAPTTSGSGGLGDLASLTSASALDNLDGVLQQQLQAGGGIDVEVEVDEEGKPLASTVAVLPSWTAKYTLRSHFDAVRALTFHHTEQILLTGSEDCTLRLWSLAKRVQAKKSSCLDVEPIYTCRGHTSPVLSVALLSVATASGGGGGASVKAEEIVSGRRSPMDIALEANFAFSGSLDGELRSWRLGGLQLMLYEAFDPSVAGPLLRGHTDAVWSLAVRCDGALLSASSDGTVQLWHTLPTLQQQQAFKRDQRVLAASRVFRPVAPGTAVPTSVIFVPPAEAAVEALATTFAVGLTNGDVCVFDLDTGRQLHRIEALPANPSGESGDACVVQGHPGAVNAMAAAVGGPAGGLVFVAHEQRQIRFVDAHRGVCLHSMVAHLEGVTSLALDPRATVLLSASHDASIRLWDVETRTCVQEFTSHRRKHDESIHAVAFHPTLPLIASAGADGLAKVYI